MQYGLGAADRSQVRDAPLDQLPRDAALPECRVDIDAPNVAEPSMRRFDHFRVGSDLDLACGRPDCTAVLDGEKHARLPAFPTLSKEADDARLGILVEVLARRAVALPDR